MVVDSSAIVAVLMDEPERGEFRDLISRDPACLVSEVTVVETSIVLEARTGDPDLLDAFLRRGEVERVPVDYEQTEAARRAWRRFGKGRHSAGLNLGDCFSYALSVTTGQPLLFKGDDFARTDVEAASSP